MKKILFGIVAIVIIIGIIMGVNQGFNLGLTYGNSQKIEVNLGKTVTINEIKDIANQVFENEQTKVQTVEVFDDTACITVKQATDEQIDKLVNAVNEKYQKEYTKDSLEIINVPSIQLWDLVKRYIMPIALTIVISVVYMSIRFYKLTFWKVAIWSILSSALGIAFVVSVYAIARIPVNELAMPIVLVVLAGTLFVTEYYFENKLAKTRIEE